MVRCSSFLAVLSVSECRTPGFLAAVDFCRGMQIFFLKMGMGRCKVGVSKV